MTSANSPEEPPPLARLRPVRQSDLPRLHSLELERDSWRLHGQTPTVEEYTLGEPAHILPGSPRLHNHASGGSAAGNAYVDIKRGDLIWRLARDKAQVTLELRFQEDRDYPAYSTDILKRWLSRERDDEAALLTDEVIGWVRDHLTEIERVLDERRAETIAEWDSLKRQRARELFG